LDFIDLNRALKCPNNKLPNIARFEKRKGFTEVSTTLDAKQGFWQNYGAGLFIWQLHYSCIAATLRLHS
jgi:hypothetical protein